MATSPPHTISAAAMLRDSGNIFDMAKAICSRSNRALGFVKQHRVHLLMNGLCRVANSCKAALIVGASRIACNGLCTAARFHTVEENPECLLGCHGGLDCFRHYKQCPHVVSPHLFALARHQRVYITTAIFNGLLFKIAVRSDRLCILVAGLLDAFVAAFQLMKNPPGPRAQFQRTRVSQN